MSDIISLNIELKSVVTLEHTGLGGAWAHGPIAILLWAQVRNGPK